MSDSHLRSPREPSAPSPLCAKPFPPPASTASFPGVLHTAANPAPRQAAPADAPPPTPSRHDLFGWADAPPPTSDISDPAPTHAPDQLGLHARHVLASGAWYAFGAGLHSPIGAAAFADQAALSLRTARRPRLPPRTQLEREQARDDEDDDDGDDANDDDDDFSETALWNRCYNGSFGPRLPNMAFRPRTQSSTSPSNADITAEQAANGTDVQGIPWDHHHVSREDYRAMRLRDGTRRDAHDYPDGMRDVLKEPRRGAQFYDFFRNARRVKCSIVHFQLRNLAWATSKHDVYVMHDGSVVHWDAAAQRKTPVLDLSGLGRAPESGLGAVQISTMIAQDDLVIAGGFYGEMVAKNVKTGALIHNKRITYDENAITNAIDIFDDTIMTSNNDCYVRCFDMQTVSKISSFKFPTPVNHATRQPGGKMVAVAGDANPIQVIDGDSGDRIVQLHGHEDFSFATAWHPNGRMFATGSQDRTCRVWDVRNMSQSFSVLGAHIGAVRSLRFSACGRFLVMAEPRDFAHIFDVNRGQFDTCQEIDLFGEIAGIALTPNAEGLFIAIHDRNYSSLLEYERRTNAQMAELVF